MSAIAISLVALLATPEVTIERGVPWYWPVGPVYGTKKLLQGYGQYETATEKAHEGIDVDAYAGQEVRAPFDSVLIEVFVPTSPGWEHYARLTLLSEDADWVMTVTHLTDLAYSVFNEGDAIPQGALLGKVAAWPEIPGAPDFSHVHLGIYPYTGAHPYDPLTDWSLAPAAKAEADPLVYMGGFADDSVPFFSSIDGNYPVAFVADAMAEPLWFHAYDSIPEGKVDVLARVGDYRLDTFRFWYWPPLPWPLGPPVPKWWPWWFYLSPAVVAPSRLSIRITETTPSGEPVTVYTNAIDLSGKLPKAVYRGPPHTASDDSHVSVGWPDADLYFVLTHQDSLEDAWDADPGDYQVEVTAQDVAGNIAYPIKFDITVL